MAAKKKVVKKKAAPKIIIKPGYFTVMRGNNSVGEAEVIGKKVVFLPNTYDSFTATELRTIAEQLDGLK